MKASTGRLIVLALVGLTGTARAERTSAPMSVSVTVVRSCTVGGAANGSLMLACSNGATKVAVGDGQAPPIQIVSGGPLNLLPASPRTQPAATPTAAQPVRVTINF